MTRALTGSAPKISVSKRTGRTTIHLPKISGSPIAIPYSDIPTISVDMGGSETKIGVMEGNSAVHIMTLPPYVLVEDVPKGTARRVSRQSGANEIGGISALLTSGSGEKTSDSHDDDEKEAIDKNHVSFERKGRRISGGKSAGDLGGATGLGASKLELLEEKVIMALIMAGVTGDKKFKLSITLPYKRDTFEAEQARVPRLLRNLSWSLDGKSHKPEPELIKVVPEGAHGHLYPMLVDPDLPDYSRVKHMNIDGGWREIKALAFDSTNLGVPSKTQSGICEFGINEAYRRVAEIIGETNHESPEFVNAVNEALQKKEAAPPYYVRSIGESVSLWEEAQSVFDDFQSEYTEQVLTLVQPGYNHFCLFGGVMNHFGEPIADEIEDRTGGECTIIDPFPQYVNVFCQTVDLACTQ